MTNRRICKFVNPIDGEIDWFEPDTVCMVSMPSVVSNEVKYEVGWINIEKELAVVLFVRLNNSDRTYGVKMNEIVFAGMFAEVVYSDKQLSSCVIIQEMTKRAIRGYLGEDVVEGILLIE
jgi:hypothetical protein